MRLMILFVLSFAGAALAQEPKQDPKHEAAEDKARTVPGGASKGVQACHEDIERWCGSVKPGAGRLGACLKKNARKLSKECRRWTRHGGWSHVDRAFKELDKPVEQPETRP